VAGKLDPAVDLSVPERQRVSAGGETALASVTSAAVEQETQLTPTLVPGAQLIVGPAGAPQQMQGPAAEARVASLHEKPLAPVVQLPTPAAAHPQALAVT